MINDPQVTRARQLLQAARKYIERGWSQGASARNAYGEPAPADSARAASFCMFGAFSAAVSEVEGKYASGYNNAAANMALMMLRNAIPETQGQIAKFNDAPERTKEEVLERIDRAIAS